MGVAGEVAGEIRGDGAGGGRRAVHAAGPAGSGAISGRRARRGDRTAVLDLRVPACQRSPSLLRPRQPRVGDPRRHAVHGHHRCAPDRARRQDRRRPVEHPGGQAGREDHRQVRHHPRAADREGQGHRRHGRRGSGRARLHRRVRCEKRQGTVALLHHPRTGRERERDLVGRVVENRRRRRLEQRRLRSGRQPRLLRHRQSGAGLGRPLAPRRQLVQRQRRRARRRDRPAEMALPVHPARRSGLRLHAGPRPRRHGVAGPSAQGDVVGESQRPRLRAGSGER